MTTSPGARVGGEELLDSAEEARAVDRPIEDAWRLDPIGAQGGDEGRRPPVAVRDLGPQPLADRGPAAQRHHIGLRPCLVDKDEAGGIKPALTLLPLRQPPRDLRPQLLGGKGAFF
jgi:hypothetical protein